MNSLNRISRPKSNTTKLKHLISGSTIAMTMLLAAPAAAQLPAGCTPTNPVAGDTVQCDGVIAGPITTTVNDLTVLIGTAGSSATVNGTTEGVSMSGSNLTLNVIGAATVVNDGVSVVSSGGDVNVTSEGTLNGNASDGLQITNAGTGAVYSSTSNTYGGNSSNAGKGIYVKGEMGSSDISVTSSGISTGTYQGIGINNQGIGSVSINANNVIGSSEIGGPKGMGIYVRNGVFSNNLTVDVETVSSYRQGIALTHEGSGAVKLHVKDVTNQITSAISILNDKGTDTNVDVSGDVTSGRSAIALDHNGSGSVKLNAVNITSAGSDAIHVYSGYNSNSITIDVEGTITADDDGIYARNIGLGGVTITANNIYSRFQGLSSSTENGDQVVVVSGTVTGGVGILNNGTGQTTLDVNNVDVALGDAVDVRTSGSDVLVNVRGTVSGYTHGVDVNQSGEGNLSVVISGRVSGGDFHSSFYGLNAYVGSNGGELNVTSSGEIEGPRGIRARNLGTGTTNIIVNDVLGTSKDAIYARNNGGGAINVSVVGGVKGQNANGIQTRSVNDSIVTIQLNAGSIVNSLSGVTILDTDGDATVTIGAGATVSGEIRLGDGSDTLTITSGADVRGITVLDGGDDEGSADGFVDVLSIDGVALTLDASNIINWEEISITNSALVLNDIDTDRVDMCGGSTVIGGASMVNDVVGCGAADGISILDTTVVADDVNGAGGNDIITVMGDASVNGRVLGGSGNDEIVINTSRTVGSVNSGSGDDEITLAGGTILNNVFSLTGEDTITLSGATVNGIIGSGDQVDTINVISGSVQRIKSGKHSDIITVSGGLVSNDIRTASGADTVTVTGGEVAKIITNSGGDMVSVEGGAVTTNIQTGAGDDTLSISGGTVSGNIRMGLGSDAVTITGGDVSGLVVLDGGDDDMTADGFTDVLTVSGVTLDLAPDRIINWEEVNISGSDVTFMGAASIIADGQSKPGLDPEMFDQVTFTSAKNSLAGHVNALQTDIMGGAFVDTKPGASIAGNLSNQGKLAIASHSAGTLTIGGDFSQSQQGSMSLDVNGLSGHDQIVVKGRANLSGSLDINQNGFVKGISTLIDASSISGRFNAVSLKSGLLLSNEISYDKAAGNVNLTGTQVDASSLKGLSTNQASIANAMMNDFTGGHSQGKLASMAQQTGFMTSIDTLSNTLEVLHPEEMAAGLETFRSSQSLFGQNLLDKNGDQSGTDGDRYVWGAANSVRTRLARTGGGADHETDGYEITVGTANIKAGPMKLGFAAGYSENASELDDSGRKTTESQVFRAAGFARSDLGDNQTGFKAHMDGVITYAAGKNAIDRDIIAGAINLSEQQKADPSIQSITGLSRLTLDGINGQELRLTPFIQAGFDHLSQEAATLGTGAAALELEKLSGTRATFGAGAAFNTDIGDTGFIKLTGTALRHTGDTDIALGSRFAGSRDTASRFVTSSTEVKQQFILDGSLGTSFGDGITTSFEGFAELGDLEGYGGSVRIGQRF